MSENFFDLAAPLCQIAGAVGDFSIVFGAKALWRLWPLTFGPACAGHDLRVSSSCGLVGLRREDEAWWFQRGGKVQFNHRSLGL